MRLNFEKFKLLSGYYSWKTFVWKVKKLTDLDNPVVVRTLHLHKASTFKKIRVSAKFHHDISKTENLITSVRWKYEKPTSLLAAYKYILVYLE